MGLVSNGLYPVTTDDYIYRYGNYDANGNPAYIGVAKPGTADSATGWKIIYLTYDGSGNVLTKNFPQSTDALGFTSQNNGFNFIWDRRTGYTYSA